MKHVPTAARILLGLLFVVTGLNGFLNFLPQPKEPMPQAAMDFAMAMMKTGYFFKFVFLTQLVGGALLLSNRFVALGLALLAPVVVNIICFHVFLHAPGIAMALPVLVLEVYLAWAYRDAFKPMLAARVEPRA